MMEVLFIIKAVCMLIMLVHALTLKSEIKEDNSVEKKDDAPQFVSPLEFAVNLITNLNEQASKDEENAKKIADEFMKRLNKVKDSL